MWRGLADMPFPDYVEYCRLAGAEVIELSGWPSSYSETLRLDDEGVDRGRRDRPAGDRAGAPRARIAARHAHPEPPGGCAHMVHRAAPGAGLRRRLRRRL